MSVLVSVVIPVFNAAPYLDECLRSIAGQSFKSIEIIIINDGSTDNSEEVIKKYSSSDSRIKYFSQDNHGLGYTRNRGISLTEGQYIFFLDSDDTIPRNAIQKLVEAASKEEADYSAGKVLRFNKERKYVPIRHLEFKLYKKSETTTVSQNPEILQDSIACNKLWKKDFLVKNELSFTEGKLYEDLALTLKAAVLANKIAVIDDVVYHWRVREEEGQPSITQEQMKLHNTLDRLHALQSNRLWLRQAGVRDRVMEENDLKSLLDVLRLHVIKYAQIEESEKQEWQNRILGFLKEIPDRVADRLPKKEKNLYDLLISGNFTDLALFSKMYTNTETVPIVLQKDNEFILKGTKAAYNVTGDLKPIMIVRDIKEKADEWVMTGEITIPKASSQIIGEFYGLTRISKEFVKTSMTMKSSAESALYPYEKQSFKVSINPALFCTSSAEPVFDFYYRLSGDDTLHKPARVRLASNLKMPLQFKAARKVITLYRTNYGNLSIRIENFSLAKNAFRLISRYVSSGR